MQQSDDQTSTASRIVLIVLPHRIRELTGKPDPLCLCLESEGAHCVMPLPNFLIVGAPKAGTTPHRARSATLQRLLVLPPEPLRRLYSRLPCRMRAATHRLAKKFFAADLTPSNKPPLDPQTARRLMQRYESSIRELEKILQRDLSIWGEGQITCTDQVLDSGY